MLKSVHALAGSDLFLQLNTLAELLRQAPADVQRIDFNGETVELATVFDELRSFAMFSSAKIVVVRDADDFVSRFREQLEEYVQHPSGNSTLVLRLKTLPKNQRIYKQISASGQVHDCEPPKLADLPAWIIQRAKSAHRLTIRPDAARLMADNIGDDLGRIDNELAKLALQVDSGVVDAAAVSASVVFQREQEMWDMTDEVAAGRTAQALKRWRQLVQLDSSSEFKATAWLTIWLEKARRALALKRQGMQEFAIAKEVKIWPSDKIKPFFQTANKLGEQGVNHLIDLLAEIDHRSKSGRGEMAENIERFLLEAGRN